MHIKSGLLEKIPGVLHGFGSLDEEVPSPLKEIFDRTHASWRQVHGTACVRLDAPHTQGLEADAFWTEKTGLAVAVVTADCVPILLARRDGTRVGAIHAGWRGTIAHITRHFFEAVGDSPTDWVAAIGPSIGPCCYEVSEELAGDFAREFPDIAAAAVPRFRHLDLPAINEAELKRLGVADVELLRACTRCSVSATGAPLFRSYRREGGKTRQYSVISC
ncbi:MAG: peptidoglycan editing factor PgeF [Oligoflexia bacterium]|nr:peptidoglycan editing factor PgeF [Oligoflexia bacterium]